MNMFTTPLSARYSNLKKKENICFKKKLKTENVKRIRTSHFAPKTTKIKSTEGMLKCLLHHTLEMKMKVGMMVMRIIKTIMQSI